MPVLIARWDLLIDCLIAVKHAFSYISGCSCVWEGTWWIIHNKYDSWGCLLNYPCVEGSCKLIFLNIIRCCSIHASLLVQNFDDKPRKNKGECYIYLSNNSFITTNKSFFFPLGWLHKLIDTIINIMSHIKLKVISFIFKLLLIMVWFLDLPL